ncbi:hypothetical protein [Bradyrhizobium sp. SZCCHNS3053]|uniref:hypothetical protein n=1 Tax=Bradyrhizobium sp. SZCCHNS3053 TaxID=3057322 RepID=UPI002916AFA8|nr:hypothetical protein [Bradyrhizobium sp. SZCCHNS3053]
MANSKAAAAPAAAAPDPEKQYRLKLARAVEIAPKVWARPANETIVKGSLIAGLGDAVIGYEEV